VTRRPEPLTDPNELRRFRVRLVIKTWRLWWPLIAAVDQRLVLDRALRQRWHEIIFERPWRRWHRFAYVAEIRDVFFEYIMRFFYKFPIKKGDVVVQIGASAGEETLRFARSVGRNGRVIAIEPAPSNVERLMETFTTEAFPQVTIVPRAAARQQGRRRFFLGFEKEGRLADIPAQNLTYEWWGVEDHLSPERYKGEITVEVDTPASLLAPFELANIDFVLIETNGTELEVVQAMDPILPMVERIGCRGHVRRDGVPIYKAIESHLKDRDFETSVTEELMVLARRPARST
jgi:FkbM family methyltransferase